MSIILPQQIDPLALADKGVKLQGELSLDSMPRLLPLLYRQTGVSRVNLNFAKTPEGISYIEGEIDAEVSVPCQRCLEGLELSLHLPVALELLREAEASPHLGEAYEPLYIEQPPCSLTDLIEDELLLALPISPRHDDDCGKNRPEDTTTATSARPFAILSALKIKAGK